MERMMKLPYVILRAMAKMISWLEAAGIAGGKTKTGHLGLFATLPRHFILCGNGSSISSSLGHHVARGCNGCLHLLEGRDLQGNEGPSSVDLR
jgi:hypothetical protein